MSGIRIGVLTPSIDGSGGGLATVVHGLTRGLSRAGHQVTIFAETPEITSFNEAEWDHAELAWTSGTRASSIARRTGKLRQMLGWKGDLVHVHGLWSPLSLLSVAWEAMSGRPRIVSPHGMLEPWALRQGKVKKRIALRSYERLSLNRAKVLHALTETELTQVRRCGLNGPVVVIPNGIQLPRSTTSPAALNAWVRSCPDRKRLRYIGRLHPKKGLEELLYAWHAVRTGSGDVLGGWQLEIAGSGDKQYAERLHHIVMALNLSESVTLLGPLYGERKQAFLSGADAFVLPSQSEGLPMSILEAWAHSKPVLITDQCNLNDAADKGAGIVVRFDIEALAHGIRRICGLSEAARVAMGAAGRRLAEERYTWDAVAQEFVRVYAWMLDYESPVPKSLNGL